MPINAANPRWDDDILFRSIFEMQRLEARTAFIGYTMHCTQWMLDCHLKSAEYECRHYADQLLQERIIERHDVHNPNNPDHPRSAA